MERKNKPDDAHALYMKAWAESSNNYEQCIAAHFAARQQKDLEETLRWNIEALNRANAVNDDRVKSFYPSLFLSVGLSYEKLGNRTEAKKFFDLAFEKADNLPHDDYGKEIRQKIDKARERVNKL